MKIIDLKCVILGLNPVIRIVTDEGIDGYGEIESTKPYVVSNVVFFKEPLLGEDPTNVERVMLKIRQRLVYFIVWIRFSDETFQLDPARRGHLEHFLDIMSLPARHARDGDLARDKTAAADGERAVA